MKFRFVCLFCASVLLLCACADHGAAIDGFRSQCAENRYTARAEVTVPRADETISFTLDVSADGGETTVRVVKPEAIAGVTAHLRGASLALDYDGMILDAGTAAPGVSAVNCVPLILQTAAKGQLRDREEGARGGETALLLTFEDGTLTGRVSLGAGGVPLAAEIAQNGVSAAFVTFERFVFSAP